MADFQAQPDSTCQGTRPLEWPNACGLDPAAWSLCGMEQRRRAISGHADSVRDSQQPVLVDRVGSNVLGVFEFVGAVATFGARAAVEVARPPYEPREILRHLYDFGYRSAPLILAAGFAVGVVLSMHTRASLERFGAEAMIPAGLAIALIRETGPLVTGLLVSGRVGAGIGAEIGAMKVTEQIDALEATAVDAFKYLAVTRILALMIAMPLLTIMMDFSGIVGGYVAEAVVSGMSWQQ